MRTYPPTGVMRPCGWPLGERIASRKNQWTLSNTPGIIYVTSWQAGSFSGMFLSYISNKIGIRTWKAGSISSSDGRKNLVAVRKISAKIQQIVLVLFVLGVPAAQQRQALRLEKTGEAMGS